MNEIIIGIDLGTTNSEVAVVREGRVQVLHITADSKLLPSVVGLADDGTLLVGEAAWNQYALYPERSVRSIKRRMGSDLKVNLGGQEYTPQEISALILKRLKQVAESFTGEEVRKAVITVPAYFSDAQRQATRDAGEIAGLEVARIINEPTAAALAYETGAKGRKQILVYDLGGGTFDVSVVRLENDVVEVLASHGNNHLGGDDFDQKIVEHVLAHLKQSQGLDPAGSKQAMARILRAAESAKIVLSDQPFARVEEEYLMERDGVPVHLSMELSRDDYEAMIQPFIDRTERLQQRFGVAVGLAAVAFHVPFLQHPADGVRDGKDQAALLKNGMLAADALELFHDLIHRDPGPQGQGDQPADGLGLGGGGSPGLADGGEHFKGLAVQLGDGDVEMAQAGFDLGGESLQGFRSFSHGS